METASTICPRDCPLALAWRERLHRGASSAVGPAALFQHSAGLNEQATIDGFVGHAQALVIRILGLTQPSGNHLLGRPVQDQFTLNDVHQVVFDGKEALLWPQG